jgi:hypothetical protein
VSESDSDPSRVPDLLRDELDRYLDYNIGLEELRNLLPRDFSILDTNGPWLEFTRVPATGPTIAEFATSMGERGFPVNPALVKVLEKIVPGGRFHKHQAAGIEALLRGQNVILPHPTGSGKTETFVVPILNYLLDEIRTQSHFGLGCLMVFPTKALENDQRDRLKKMLFLLEEELTDFIPIMGVYDGDTPTQSDFDNVRNNPKREALKQYSEQCPRCADDTLKYSMGSPAHLLRCIEDEDSQGRTVGCGYPEDLPAGIPWIRTTREDMRHESYPNLLITNPESLDFRLLTPSDTPVLKTKMPRIIVVVDEAHAYSAGAALSLRFLLSRLEEKVRRVNTEPIQFQYVIASATLDEPLKFARKVLPWVDFQVVAFEPRPDAFPSGENGAWALDAPLGWIDVESIDWILELLGAPVADAPRILKECGHGDREPQQLLSTLVRLGIIELTEGKLEPASDRVDEAWSLYRTQRESRRHQNLVVQILRERLAQLEQARELFAFIEPQARSLSDVVSWWQERWPAWQERQTREAILQLVFLGRRLELWNERWHLFVRSPTGIAGCVGPILHAIRLSEQDSLPARCKSCEGNVPVCEILTCKDCGEVYFAVFRCPLCDRFGASDVLSCDHDAEVVRYAVRRSDMIGLDLSSLNSGIAFEIGEEGVCQFCSGPLQSVRRRTDLVVEMSVSLVGWHSPEPRRRFLLFTDGRAGSERVSREFNNLETKIWAERLVFDIIRTDPNHALHDPRSILEVRRKLFARLYRPYRLALKGVVRRYEYDILEKTLSSYAFQALERGNRGSSRLFDAGLLGYSFDEFEARIRQLGLEHVLPRLCDLIRRKANSEKGIEKARLIKAFRSAGNPSAKQRFEAHAGDNNQKIEEALTLLEDVRWIQQTRKPNETWIRFVTGEFVGENVFEAARDVRRIGVPREVSVCSSCGKVSWYLVELCEACGQRTEQVIHSVHVQRHYFAGILAREPKPIVGAVHRAGLQGIERRIVEARFRAEENPIHFLSATPTLELGIDVGTLNFVLLSRVPPTRSNYIQRVGRAGRRRREGAVCITFTYPNPLDAYYFRNPKSLVSMRAGRLPVQRLSPEHLPPPAWSGLIDCLAFCGSSKAKDILEGGHSTREFLEGQLDYHITDLARDLSTTWTNLGRSWAESVLKRAALLGEYSLTPADVANALEGIDRVLADLDQFSTDVLKLESFRAHEMQIKTLHASVASQIAQLRNAPSTAEAAEELKHLVKQDDSLREYEDQEMVRAQLPMYLHSIGTVSSARGLTGSNVATFDLEAMAQSIDERDSDLAIADRFPGAYVSRQGAIYQVVEVVFDPLEHPTILQCSNCELWLPDGTIACESHPNARILQRVLEKPIVAFAKLTRSRTLETRGLLTEAIRPQSPSREWRPFLLGHLSLRIGNVEKIDVATMNQSFDVFDQGQRVHQDLPIRVCQNCGLLFRKGVQCCSNPQPRDVVQGRVFPTRGVQVDVIWDAEGERLLNDLQRQFPEVTDPKRSVVHSLANSLLNSFAIKLEVEPTMLDVSVDSDHSFWLIETAKGGYGLLDDALGAEPQIELLFSGIRDIVSATSEHSCPQFCDQCLIVPRYSRNELVWLHRPLLEALLRG